MWIKNVLYIVSMLYSMLQVIFHLIIDATLIANAASPLITRPLLKYNFPKPALIGKLPPNFQAPTKIATVQEFNVARCIR